MFRGIVDFFRRLRLPSGRQMFGLFYASRSVTSALTSFNPTITELNDVAVHHTAQARAKADQATSLNAQAGDHNEEAKSAVAIAGKLTALLA